MTTYPLEHGNITPGEGGTLLTGKNYIGLPDGCHTGGAWLMPDGNVYKPLDCRPYANAECRVDTQEAEALFALQHINHFPMNWHTEVRNGRNWLVRKKVTTNENAIYKFMKRSDLLSIEQSIRQANALGWELSDLITIGFDEDLWEYFILDLSTAHTLESKVYKADDSHQILRLFEYADPWLAKLRHAGADVRRKFILETDLFHTDKQQWKFVMEQTHNLRHIYASFPRPLSTLWADFGKDNKVWIVQNQYLNYDECQPLSWLMTEKPLDAETIYRYELVWAYSPAERTEENG